MNENFIQDEIKEYDEEIDKISVFNVLGYKMLTSKQELKFPNLEKCLLTIFLSSPFSPPDYASNIN